MPSSKLDNDFAKQMQDNVDEVRISSTALDSAIEFISDNCTPEEVFSEKQLSSWAENNGYIKE